MTSEDILQIVCDYFKISNKDVLTRSRKAEIIRAKHFIMYFCRTELGMSLAKSAMVVKRHHATCLNAIKSVNNQFDTDIKYRRIFNDLVNLIKNNNVPDLELEIFEKLHDDKNPNISEPFVKYKTGIKTFKTSENIVNQYLNIEPVNHFYNGYSKL